MKNNKNKKSRVYFTLTDTALLRLEHLSISSGYAKSVIVQSLIDGLPVPPNVDTVGGSDHE